MLIADHWSLKPKATKGKNGKWIVFKVLTAFFAMTLSSSVAGEMSGRILPMNPFFIVVKIEKERTDKRAIELTVELVNTSDNDVEITVISGDQPFVINVYDKNGVDINRHVFYGWSKDRSNHSAKLHLSANGEKTQKIKLLTVKDEKGAEKRISPGTYNVRVVLPVVTYVEGQYKTELVKSDLIAVTVE